MSALLVALIAVGSLAYIAVAALVGGVTYRLVKIGCDYCRDGCCPRSHDVSATFAGALWPVSWAFLVGRAVATRPTAAQRRRDLLADIARLERELGVAPRERP